MDLKENILNTILKDDNTPNGGTSHSKETLFEFLSETGISLDSTLGTINFTLTECGIFPINYFNYPEIFEHTLNDLKYYVSNHYKYLDNFIYIKNNKEFEVSFLEEILIENIERNTIQYPHEFAELLIGDNQLILNGELSS